MGVQVEGPVDPTLEGVLHHQIEPLEMLNDIAPYLAADEVWEGPFDAFDRQRTLQQIEIGRV